MQFITAICYMLTYAVSAYKTSRTYNLNGRVYMETFDQPWFRYPHLSHPKMPASRVNASNFGKHNLPEDDVYVPHEWTNEEKKYLPCLDLLCVCPYYGANSRHFLEVNMSKRLKSSELTCYLWELFEGQTEFFLICHLCYAGKISASKCVLENGKTLEKAVRKEARQLSDSERFQIASAFNKMKTAGVYDRIGFVHKYSGLHEGPGFFTWHREYLKRFEIAFRRYLPAGSRLGLPYWDSTLESELPDPRESLFFSALFVGASNSSGQITDGPFSDWLNMEKERNLVRFVPDQENGEVLNNARIDVVLEQNKVENILAAAFPLETCKIATDDERLLSYSHDYVHYFINGDMRETYSATSEPIFFYHHSMMDNIWELWRQRHQTRKEREEQYPPSYPDCYPPTHFVNASMKELQPYMNEDALSNKYTDNMYDYTERPNCSKINMDCGSRYLFCHNVGNFYQCIAKLRERANCEGFERTPICYEGTCHNGRCLQNIVTTELDPADFT